MSMFSAPAPEQCSGNGLICWDTAKKQTSGWCKVCGKNGETAVATKLCRDHFMTNLLKNPRWVCVCHRAELQHMQQMQQLHGLQGAQAAQATMGPPGGLTAAGAAAPAPPPGPPPGMAGAATTLAGPSGTAVPGGPGGPAAWATLGSGVSSSASASTSASATGPAVAGAVGLATPAPGAPAAPPAPAAPAPAAPPAPAPAAPHGGPVPVGPGPCFVNFAPQAPPTPDYGPMIDQANARIERINLRLDGIEETIEAAAALSRVTSGRCMFVLSLCVTDSRVKHAVLDNVHVTCVTHDSLFIICISH
jgi:hypothetical protein